MGNDSKKIITISRQYGSGGREVGKRLADSLGFAYYDHELLDRAAEESGLDRSFMEKDDEKPGSSLAYLFSYSSNSNGEPEALSASDRVFLAQASVIRQIAEEGDCVIIGRCADYLLEDRDDVINIYIYADWDSRVSRVAQRNNLTEEQSVARIKKINKLRESYYQRYTDRKWGRAENFDLCLSSSRLGIEATVKVIDAYLQLLSETH